jgi:hypothetical protein
MPTCGIAIEDYHHSGKHRSYTLGLARAWFFYTTLILKQTFTVAMDLVQRCTRNK